MKSENARLITELLVFAVVAAGLVFNTGIGTLCSIGIDAVATICPLGALGVALAGKAVSLRGIVCFIIAVVVLLVVGRAGCAWLCPVPLVRRMFGGKKSVAKNYSDAKDEQKECQAQKDEALEKLIVENEKTQVSVDHSSPFSSGGGALDSGLNPSSPSAKDTSADSATLAQRVESRQISEEFAQIIAEACSSHGCAGCSNTTCGEQKKKEHEVHRRFKTSSHDSRLAVLVGALASTVVVGFPVFCLICPVGLTIGTFIGVWRLITMNQGTWMLVLMPVLLILELTVLKKWCHRFCPLGALFSLIARGNKTLLPVVDEKKCLRLTGTATCHACYTACPEGIDLQDPASFVGRNECIRCRSCVDACPQQCITVPFIPKSGKGSSAGGVVQVTFEQEETSLQGGAHE